MSDLASNALINHETFIVFRGGDPLDTKLSEDRVNMYINMASQAIENYCARKFIEGTDLEEIFGGDGEKDYIVQNLPLTGTPTIYYWDGTQWVEATASNYPRATDSASGRIWFNEGNKFWKGDDNWRVVYDYGYAIESVPGDLQHACCILVQRAMLKAEGKEGVASESHIDKSITFDLSKMPVDVQGFLNSYKRFFLG